MILILFIIGCIIITFLSNSPSKKIRENQTEKNKEQVITDKKDEESDNYTRVTRMSPEQRLSFLQKRDEFISENIEKLTDFYSIVFDKYFNSFMEYKDHFLNGTLDELDDEVRKNEEGGLLEELLTEIVNKKPKKEYIPKIKAHLINNLEQFMELYNKMIEFVTVVQEYETIIYRDTYILGFTYEDKFLKLNSEEVNETYNRLIVLKCEASVLNELLFEYDKRGHYLSNKEYKKEFVSELLSETFLDTILSLEIR